MGVAAFVRGLAAFAGDCPLALRVHGGKTAFGFATLVAALAAPLFAALPAALVATLAATLITLIARSHLHCLLQEKRVERIAPGAHFWLSVAGTIAGHEGNLRVSSGSPCQSCRAADVGRAEESVSW